MSKKSQPKQTAKNPAARKAGEKHGAAHGAKPSAKPDAKQAVRKSAQPAKKPAAKMPEKKMSPAQKLSNEQRIKHALKKLTGGGKDTPAIFKLPAKRHTPMVFSLNEVRDLIKEKSAKGGDEKKGSHSPAKKASAPAPAPEAESKPRVLKSATLDDLLGGKKNAVPTIFDEKKVPQKFLAYYKKLMAMRERLLQSVEERSEQTLKTSGKDAAGDLSSYGQHIADAGTDAYDYDFALSLVSSDKEMLREVEAAIGRIFDGSYGVCEVTGKPISRDRLNAVPFTRFSKEGQDQFERTRRRSAQRVGIASGEDGEDAESSGGDDDVGEV